MKKKMLVLTFALTFTIGGLFYSSYNAYSGGCENTAVENSKNRFFSFNGCKPADGTCVIRCSQPITIKPF